MGKRINKTKFYYDRAVEIKRRAQEESFAAIGRDLGLSRERVRQIAGKLDRCPEGYLPLKKYAAIKGIRPDLISRMACEGRVVSLKLGWYRFVKADSVVRPCALCGQESSSRGHGALYCKDCSEVARTEARKRCQWRTLHRKKGIPLPPSLAYVRKEA